MAVITGDKADQPQAEVSRSDGQDHGPPAYTESSDHTASEASPPEPNTPSATQAQPRPRSIESPRAAHTAWSYSSAMSSAAGASKAARHLRIEQQHNSIKGTYAISPSVPDGTGPPVFDMPLETDRQEYASSARFESVTSAVNVEVNVFGDGYGHGNGKGKEVSVMAKSRNGNVKIVVPDYKGSNPLKIFAKTHSGTVYVHVPPSFSGTLTWHTTSGSFKPSARMRERLSLDGKIPKHGSGTVQGLNAKHSHGDVCELRTTSGSIRLHEAGEQSDSSNNCVTM